MRWIFRLQLLELTYVISCEALLNYAVWPGRPIRSALGGELSARLVRVGLEASLALCVVSLASRA